MNNFKSRARALSTSTPIQNNLKKFVSDEVSMINIDVASSSTGETEPAKMKKKATILDMVIESIKAVGEPRKGASYQAIKKWISDNKEIDSIRLKVLLKMALKKGIDQGILGRPSRSATVMGALGYFKLLQTKPVKPSKMAVKKTANKIPAKKAKSPIQDTKISKMLYELPAVKIKKPVNASSKAKAGIGRKIAKDSQKKVAKKTATKATATKKSAAKKPASKKSAAKKPAEAATKVSSKTEAEKPAEKALLKAKVPNKPEKKATATTNPTAEVLSKPAAEKLVKKVPLKAEVQETTATKKATATNKPTTEMPLKAEAEKKKVPSNTKEGKNTTTKGASKVKASKLLDESSHKKNNLNDTKQERQELSDTEIDIRKTPHKRMFFSSDTELEISKREEKSKKKLKKKLPIKAKKVASKI